MTQEKINKAYQALMRMSELRLPVKKARSLYTLIKKAEEHFQFAVSEERKYIIDSGATENNDGTISFKNQEQFAIFQEKMAELREMEVEWELSPIPITESDLGEQTITSADIYNLEGFIIFE